MDIIQSAVDPLDQEIALKEADNARIQANIDEAERQLAKLKQEMEYLAIELKTLKRAASLRPQAANNPPAPTRPAFAPVEPPQPTVTQPSAAPQAGRFRDVVDQIRAGR